MLYEVITVFSVSFTDIDPEFAKGVVNFAVGYLETRVREMGLDKNQLQKENLEKNSAKTYDEIMRLEDEGQRLDQSAARGSYSAGGSSLILRITSYNVCYTKLLRMSASV